MVLASVASLLVASCAPPEAAPVEAEPEALVTAFPSGSLVIPMSTTHQDTGTLRAFGLVYQLLRNGVTVH
ncbi:MAG: hypothetical protein OHK0013_29410 [Sandaracinaceae bacterium]